MTTATELCGSSAHAHFENKPQVTRNHSSSQKDDLRTRWHPREAKVRSSFGIMLVPWICSGSLRQDNKNPRVCGVLQKFDEMTARERIFRGTFPSSLLKSSISLLKPSSCSLPSSQACHEHLNACSPPSFPCFTVWWIPKSTFATNRKLKTQVFNKEVIREKSIPCNPEMDLLSPQICVKHK